MAFKVTVTGLDALRRLRTAVPDAIRRQLDAGARGRARRPWRPMRDRSCRSSTGTLQRGITSSGVGLTHVAGVGGPAAAYAHFVEYGTSRSTRAAVHAAGGAPRRRPPAGARAHDRGGPAGSGAMTQLAWPAAVADVSLQETIQIQAIAWLKADARITALVGTRIYTNIPASTTFPLLLLEGFVPGPANRFRGYGFVVSFQLRAQSQKAGPYEVDRISDRVIQVLTDRAGAAAAVPARALGLRGEPADLHRRARRREDVPPADHRPRRGAGMIAERRRGPAQGLCPRDGGAGGAARRACRRAPDRRRRACAPTRRRRRVRIRKRRGMDLRDARASVPLRLPRVRRHDQRRSTGGFAWQS